jgi:hypothetical protein
MRRSSICGGGSVGFTALVRVILAALPDPDDESGTKFFFAVAKNNLVPRDRRPALRYEIVPSDFDKDIGRIAWGQKVDRSATEILQALATFDQSGKMKGRGLSSNVPGEWSVGDDQGDYEYWERTTRVVGTHDSTGERKTSHRGGETRDREEALGVGLAFDESACHPGGSRRECD